MRHTLTTLAFVALPSAVLACPVCFGQSDSPMAQGVNMGIYVLLGITGGVLAAFATFFIYLIRRARLFAGDPADGAADGARLVSDPQEGTA